MASRARKSDVLANPFHLVLLALAVAFVLTALAYLASGFALDESRPVAPSEASRRAARWIDRNGPRLLAAELILMLPAAALLIAFDRRLDRAKRRRRRG
ncbi:hypothetical protein [Paludisphaera mucosa]|uniref:Uncharacterized protein n=1 Tax=Paludisphaera mucosa TaxID=3030827 RepID=A0ABT6FD94_9BACT|nr:hypothetical protein [Paludisphaera mucosa]MDG3005544.1 hypothetical protein [Paludisphaera mucosa]